VVRLVQTSLSTDSGTCASCTLALDARLPAAALKLMSFGRSGPVVLAKSVAVRASARLLLVVADRRALIVASDVAAMSMRSPIAALLARSALIAAP
jgi:hypothetical protein